MRSVLLLAKKDIKLIVTSPLFFFIAALCTIVWSVTYVNFLNQFGSQGMMASMQGMNAPNIIRGVFTPHISMVNLIFIITLPALTMRLIAEEKRSRSYDLLLTSPITATEIVIGKFLAGVGAMTVLLLVSFLYPLATSLIADFHWPTVLSLFMGMFFLASLYVASGLFASSLTDSAMLAVFMGVVFNFLIWFIGPSAADSEIKWLASTMDYITVGQHMMNFVNGAIQIKSIVFFVTATAFFVFLSQRVVESSRWR
jgi:ABC-2 type transport system permease protein